MKKFLSFFLFITMLCGCITVTAEQTTYEEDISEINVPIEVSNIDNTNAASLDIKAKSAILMEPHTGKILYEKNSDEKIPPASITKIMSLLLVMEAIDNKTLSLEDVITASEHACSMGGSQIWLEPGEAMTVDDLLKATVIASANDATVALGEAIAGSEEGFVSMMNEKARKLGMNNTTFINCTGLDAEGHLTSAHDVAVMSCELIKHPLIKNYSTVWMDTLRGGESELVNTNKLVRFYNGTTGLKTGTTSGAGYCLSATAQRDNLELVAVIMGGETSNHRFEGAKKLLDYGFANFTFETVKPELENNLTVEVEKGTQKCVGANAEGSLSLLLKKGDAKNITQKIVLDKKIKAPVKKGDVIGSVNIYVNKEEIGSIDITTSEAVDKISLLITLKWLFLGMFVA